MVVVFFIYGLAFFILGFAILLYPKKESSFDLARSIYLIAWFGILHGINEWLDMFILIEQPVDSLPLEIIRMATLPVSFIFLVQFGASVLKPCSTDRRSCRFLVIVLSIIWAALFFFGPRTMLMWDVWSRYILCLPGALLTGIALLRYIPRVEPAHLGRITGNLKIAGFAFITYAFLAGVIVPKVDFFPASFLNYDAFKELFGMPVQILRSICAIIMAYSIVRVLGIFHWEIKRDRDESQLYFNAIVKQAPVVLFTTDKALNLTFIEGKGLDAFCLSNKQVVGQHITKIFGDTKELEDCCKTALEGNEFASTIKIENSSLQLFYGPLKEGDRIEGTIGVAIDITAERKMQAELDDYRNSMLEQKTLAELGTLSTEMVQKLSLPIASIKASLLTSLVALRKMPNVTGLQNSLQNGLNQSSQAMDVIDKFFSFANIAPNPKAEPIDIEQIIDRILAVFRDRISQAMIKVETYGIDVVPCMFISSHEIEQIFFSILQNAVRNVVGKDVAEMSITCDILEDKLNIVFSDDFGSIPYDDPNDIFEPFSESNGIPSKDSFGLVVLKRLVLAYNGSISARKEDAQTIIQVTLPVEKL